MKSERNNPCPCGSGLKYKKCCYLKEQNPVAPDVKPQDRQDSYKDNTCAEQSFWTKALISLRRFLLDRKSHIKEYYKIRNMHGKILDTMIQYHVEGNFEQKVNLSSVSHDKHKKRKLRLLESNFDLTTQQGLHAFYNMLIYKTDSDTNCITEDFIEKYRYKKNEEIELLQSMLASKQGLFEITGTDFNQGYAYLKEVFTGVEYTITDVGLSCSRNYEDLYLYTRIITCQDISFSSGLNLVFTKNDDFIKNYIQSHRKDYNPNEEMMRFIQLYNHYSENPGTIRVVANEVNEITQ